jgi:apolipoprotein D and lipocalin family protein
MLFSKKKHAVIIMFLISGFIFSALCAAKPDVVKETFNLDAFKGTWYEIARLPNGFERGLVEVTATFKVDKDGKIQMENKGHLGSSRGQKKVVKGEVKIPDKKNPYNMKAKFGIFSFDYRVIDFDHKDGNYALITSDKKDYLWILCKQPAMEPLLYEKLVEKASELGFRTERLQLVSQTANCAVAENSQR